MSDIVTFAKRELGITFTPGQERAVSEFEAGHFQQAVWRWGRRSGKSLTADVLALADATLRDELRSKMRPHEPRISAVLAPTMEQARDHISNIGDLVENSPRLRSMLVTQTADELSFSNGSLVKAYPCSARSIRGGAWSSVILDELGQFVTTEDGNQAGDRILEAALPSLAQFGREAWLIAISTPLWKIGAFHKLSERAESGRFDYMHHLHASTAEMNPEIEPEWLEARRLEDPDLYNREFLANWIDGASSYLDSKDVVACIRGGIGNLPRRDGFVYYAALDPAYSHDSFSMAVAHQEADERVVVDGVWAWKRHGHDRTLDEVKVVADAYNIKSLRTDQHSPVPIQEGLLKRGIHADYKPWTIENKTSAFASLKTGLNTRSIELPDHPGLIAELTRLEARPTPGGFTRIAAASSGHDDLAVAVAGVVDGLVGRIGGKRALSVMRDQLAELKRQQAKALFDRAATAAQPAPRNSAMEILRQQLASDVPLGPASLSPELEQFKQLRRQEQ